LNILGLLDPEDPAFRRRSRAALRPEDARYFDKVNSVDPNMQSATRLDGR